MFLRDEVALDYLALAILLTFPGLGIVLGTWGFFWEALLLLAVFLVGSRRGLPIAALTLMIGYAASVLIYGAMAFNSVSLVPLAGLFGVLGWHKHWPQRVTFFWGAVLAAVLGMIPTLPFIAQGINSLNTSDLINSIVQQYQTSGLMAVMQQQGITEVQLRDLLQQGIQLYALTLPGFAAFIGLVQFGFVFYLARIWIKKDQARISFTRWRLPWYAAWGAVIGITCYLLGDQFSWTVLRTIGINILVVYGPVTLLLGTSVFTYMLKSPKIPRLLKITLILTSFIYLFISIVSLIMFGLFDLVLNFRRLPEEP